MIIATVEFILLFSFKSYLLVISFQLFRAFS